MKWQCKKELELLYLGDLGDGSHLQNLEEPLVIREDALKFGGGGADEFLNREEGVLDVMKKKKGKGNTDVFIGWPHLRSRDFGLMSRLQYNGMERF